MLLLQILLLPLQSMSVQHLVQIVFRVFLQSVGIGVPDVCNEGMRGYLVDDEKWNECHEEIAQERGPRIICVPN